MTIPKRIDKLLTRRRKLAESLLNIETELDEWLNKKNIDFTQYPLADATMSSVMIYFEPAEAEKIVRDYLSELCENKTEKDCCTCTHITESEPTIYNCATCTNKCNYESR